MSDQRGSTRRTRRLGADTAEPGPPASGSSRAVGDGASPLDNLKAGVKTEVDRAKATVEEVKAEFAAASADRRGGPATSVEDATSKSDSLRRAIDRDLAALRARVPETDAMTGKARTVGLAIGGGALTLFALTTLLKRRGTRRGDERAARDQALAIARELARIDRDGGLEPDDAGDRHPLTWAVLAAAAAGAGAFAWQRSQQSVGVDDVFGDPQDDPLRPADVVERVAEQTQI